MVLRSLFVIISLFILTIGTIGTGQPALAAPEILTLTAAPGDDPVAFRVLSREQDALTLRFDLRHLQTETLDHDGQTYTALTIAGGGMIGEDGHPGLPTYSGLLALPAGHAARLHLETFTTQVLNDMRPLPVQPDDAESFVIDSGSYGAKTTTSEDFTVIIGEPAIYLGQPVVPFQVHPVKYLPAEDRVEVATSMDLRVEFFADGRGVHSRRSQDKMPASLHTALQGAVVNSENLSRATTGDDPGTYLMIVPPSVLAQVTDLAEWRRRQGYNVIVTSTAAIGSTTGLIKNHIQDVYDNVEPRLAHVVMIGDANGSVSTATHTEYISGWGGETDHYYTTLDGDDILSDVHIGRLTASNPTQLSQIIDKILAYETNPPVNTDPGWFTRATLVGDPADSGITTIYTNQWLKAQLEDIGFAQVDTIWGGNFPALMTSSVNQGVSIFGYRGFYAVSGFSTGHIYSLTNGTELPFAVLPTCDSGSFRTHSMAHSEAFLRAPSGGGIGAIGLSTIGTHTRYNNCLYNGIWEGVINSDDHRMGSALTRGKLELYNNYYLGEPNSAEIWATWANLMGDPATDVWLGLPAPMEASHAAILPPGASDVEIVVMSEGLPVADAQVALYKAGEVRSVGRTDDQGRVLLPVSGASQGLLQVTVTKHNHLPHLGSLVLGSVDGHVQISDSTIQDFLGGTVHYPGEALDVDVALGNLGSQTVTGVTAELISTDPLVTVLSAQDSFGDLGAGQTAWGLAGFQVLVADTAPDGHVATLEVKATDGAQVWSSSLRFTVSAPAFMAELHDWQGQHPNIQPGDHGDLILSLENVGSVASSSSTAVLSTSSPWVLVTDGLAIMPGLEPGASGTNDGYPFALQVDPACMNGHQASFSLVVDTGNDLLVTTEFQVTIGNVNHTDPLGPDTYGYIALDNGDLGYEDAPVYDWVELHPDLGGSGTDLGLTDYGWEQDETTVVDLPFSFQYYGQSYDRISVCSNGWIAMGETTLKHYRNWALPCAGTPAPLIAGFWDNLYQTPSNSILGWHDAAEGRYIVQWQNSRNQEAGYTTFEIILMDPAVHPTATGDGKILMQYKQVTNNDEVNGYATVGIMSPDRQDGLTYTYWNQYPDAASPLAYGRAILFQPVSTPAATTCSIAPEAWTLSLDVDQTAETTFTMSNDGEPGSGLPFTVELHDPLVGPTDADKNMEGSIMVCADPFYPMGEVVELQFSVTNNSPDNEYLDTVTLDFPYGVTVLGSTNLVYTGTQQLAYQGATGNGALAIWTGGFMTSGNTATATMTLDFTDATGNIELPYILSGDFFGGEPHSIEGTILLTPAGSGVTLLSPNGGEALVEGQVTTVEFFSNSPEFLTLELDRHGGAGWETVATDIPVAGGTYDWLVTGPIADTCELRLSDRDDPEVFDVSDGYFSIGRDLSWLTVSPGSGSVVQGSPLDLVFSIDTSGLEYGEYAVDVIVRQMATGTEVIPVRLTVTDVSATEPTLPARTRLGANHPNPFNPLTVIPFSLKQDGPVKMRVYDAQGRQVRTLVDEVFAAGEHSVTWMGLDEKGRRAPSGMYFYLMESDEGIEVRKMVLIK